MDRILIPALKSAKIGEGFTKAARPQRHIDKALPKEGYKIEATDGALCIFASCDEGFFRAKTTLQGLAATFGGVPVCSVEDAPTYPYRGVMIDCARHFFPVEDLKKMLAAASMFKINSFHWHLADDQGWRIELPEFPKLCSVGSVRGEGAFGKRKEPLQSGLFYTQNDIREIVEYCRSLYIEVIPEIDMPGHTSALLAAYPEYSCRKQPVDIKLCGGIHTDLLCGGDEAVYEFVFKLLDGIAPLFPSKKFHIGGDEAPKDEWEKCPVCQAKMEQLGFTDEEELQGYFTARLVEHLKRRGIAPVVWSDALQTRPQDPAVTVQFWLGGDEMTGKHVENGGFVIFSPFFHYYMDYPFGMTPLKKTLSYIPPLNLSDEAEKRIAGVEAPLWAEHIWTLERWAYQAFPRLAAIADAGWNGFEKRDSNEFNARFLPYEPKLLELSLTPAPLNKRDMPFFRAKADLLKFFLNAATADNIRLMRAQNKRNRRRKRRKK